jgi:hypothetical protein
MAEEPVRKMDRLESSLLRNVLIATAMLLGHALVWAQQEPRKPVRPAEPAEKDAIRGAPQPCNLGGLEVPPLEGWTTVPVKDPPAGTSGCVLVRADADGNVGGVLRAKSAERSLKGYESSPYAELLDEMKQELAGMNVRIGPWPPGADVPSAGVGFSDGKRFIVEGTIAGNPSLQTIWVVVFTGRRHYYVFSIVSPNEREFPEYWATNRSAFAKLLGELRPSEAAR